MTVLVVGGTGATGRLLVGELLERGLAVKTVVRSPDKLPAELRAHGGLAGHRWSSEKARPYD